MPISLHEIKNRGVELDIEFYDQTGVVVYDPLKITQQFRTEWQADTERRQQARIDAALKPLQAKLKKGTELTPDEQQAYDDLSAGKEGAHTDDRQRRIDGATALCQLIKSWDTLGVDGRLMPLDPEVIADELPERFVSEVTMQVFLDVNSLGRKRRTKMATKAA